MQYKIILLKFVIILSNILFVKSEICTGRRENLIEFYNFSQIKTCYFEYSCTITKRDKHGYRTDTIPTRTTTYCCHGYIRLPINDRQSLCIPKCDNSCVNGSCTEPNTCTCANGYVKSSFHPSECKPNCHPQCIRGKCIAPNICQCNSGYVMSINIQNTCGCKTGYKITERGVCIPECVPECVNGKCVAPNQCRCSSGYQPTEEQNTCKSICTENCIHGNCTDGNCVCEDERFGPDCNSTTITQNYNRDSHHRFPVEIGLSLIVLVLAGITFLLYKKQVFHCHRETHEAELDNFVVNNSIYGWVPK